MMAISNRSLKSISFDSQRTSLDFPSLDNLSQLSEHSVVSQRSADIEWLKAAQRYQQNEPRFYRAPVVRNFHLN